MSYISVNLSGGVGSIDTFQTPSGVMILNISLATNKFVKTLQGDKETVATWHKVKVIGKNAEYLLDRDIAKGDTLTILNAELENSSYEKNGQKQYITKVLCDFSTELFVRKKQTENTARYEEIPENYIEHEAADDNDDIPF